MCNERLHRDAAHTLCCRMKNVGYGVSAVHDRVVAVVARAFRQLHGCSAVPEVTHPGSGRRADLSVSFVDEQANHQQLWLDMQCVSVRGVTALGRRGAEASSVVKPGHAARMAEVRKQRTYGQAADVVPFVVEETGGLGGKAATLLSRMAMLATQQRMPAGDKSLLFRYLVDDWTARIAVSMAESYCSLDCDFAGRQQYAVAEGIHQWGNRRAGPAFQAGVDGPPALVAGGM